MARIFYFSGTGNSLAIAKRLAEGLEARLCSNPAYLEHPYLVNDAVVGFVSPVHCTELPPPVEQFLKTVRFGTGTEYLFGVVDAGSITGAALGEAGNIIAKRRLPQLGMSAGFQILLPDGSILFTTPGKRQQQMLDALDGQIADIVATVQRRGLNDKHWERNPVWMLGKKLGWPVLYDFFHVKERHVDASRCVGCGTCVQICPVHCISLENRLPVFGAGCVSCFGCAQWCPKQAIGLGRLRPSADKQYHNPLVTASEMEEAARRG